MTLDHNAQAGGPGRRNGFATRAIHVAGPEMLTADPLSPPIYQSSTFAFTQADDYSQALADPGYAYAYTRYRNPTTAVLESALSELEGGTDCIATASGMAAVSTILMTLLSSGDRIVLARELYGGTYSFARSMADRYGVDVAFVDSTDIDAVERALTDRTRVLYIETIANPTITVTDLPVLAALARSRGVTVVVDNTLASPYLCRPIEHGADVVLHSVTKYIGGHSDVIGGALVFADHDLYLRAWKTMILAGGSPDPFAAWLALRGLRTLALRMKRVSSSADALARWLEAHPRVDKVYWPGLDSHPSKALAERLLPLGYGGLLSFDMAGDRDAGRLFTEKTRLARLATSLGGIETLVSHPASTTHRQMDQEALAAAGIGVGMVRVSVGLEDPEDLIADFDQALAVTGAA